jgi:GT2 family glycosyltransferase
MGYRRCKSFLFKRKYQNKKNPFILEKGYISGAAMMLRNMNIDTILDENYFLYFDDVDICKTINFMQKDILCVPSVLIKHLGGRSKVTHDNLENFAWKRFVELNSILYYIKKWYGDNISYIMSKYFIYIDANVKHLIFSIFNKKEEREVFKIYKRYLNTLK